MCWLLHFGDLPKAFTAASFLLAITVNHGVIMSSEFKCHNDNFRLATLLQLNATLDRVYCTIAPQEDRCLELMDSSLQRNRSLVEIFRNKREDDIKELFTVTLGVYFELMDACQDAARNSEDLNTRIVMFECIAVMVLGLRRINFSHDDFKDLNIKMNRFSNKVLDLSLKEFVSNK